LGWPVCCGSADCARAGDRGDEIECVAHDVLAADSIPRARGGRQRAPVGFNRSIAALLGRRSSGGALEPEKSSMKPFDKLSVTHRVPSLSVSVVMLSAALFGGYEYRAPDPAGSSEGVGGSTAPDTARIDSVVTALFGLGAAPGMAVVVVRDTAAIYMKGFGYADLEARRPVTPQTVFYVASTTKSFTGLAAAMLDRQGKISLDAPLSRYLPRLTLQSPLNADSITIRSLLTHTHGIAHGPVAHRLAYTGEYEGNAHLARLLAEHAPAPTGRAFQYGNIGYNVAALAIDSALDESWKQWLDRLLFTPLGMRSTTAYVSRIPQARLAMPYRIEPTGFARIRYGKADANMQSAGGLVTTAEDMARWLEVHINEGRLDGRQVIPADVVAEAHRVLAVSQGNQRGLTMLGYGFGWNVTLMGGDTLLTHGGGFAGFTTHMSFMPRQRIGVVVMINDNAPLADFVAREIYTTLLGRRGIVPDSLDWARRQVAQMREQIGADRARRAARPQNLPLPLTAYAGVYENPAWGRVELSVVNGKLEARAGNAWSAVEVFDNTKHQLRVELTGTGTVVQMEIEDARAVAALMNGVRYRRVR
jgi:CubicO group peptidase (beta-lactamase class C family)